MTSDRIAEITNKTVLPVSLGLMISMCVLVYWFATSKAEAAAQRDSNTTSICEIKSDMRELIKSVHRLEVHFGTVPETANTEQGDK